MTRLVAVLLVVGVAILLLSKPNVEDVHQVAWLLGLADAVLVGYSFLQHTHH